MNPIPKFVAVLLIAFSVSACSGGGGGDDDDEDDGPEVPEPSAAGIWTGTYRIDGQTEDQNIRALVTEEGDYILQTSGTAARLFIGSGASQTGGSFSANAPAYSLTSAGKTPASVQGAIVERVSIAGSYSFTGESAHFTMAYQNAYERPASLATLAGVYSASSTSVAVNADGSFMLSMSAGCTMNGSFTVPTATRNYYRWSGSLTSCGSSNGPASGIAHLEDAPPGANNRLRMFGQNDAQTFAIVFGLVK